MEHKRGRKRVKKKIERASKSSETKCEKEVQMRKNFGSDKRKGECRKIESKNVALDLNLRKKKTRIITNKFS